MKRITVTLTDDAERVFNEIMYSLPKEKDGSGLCTQSQAISYALNRMWSLEQTEEENDTLARKYPNDAELGAEIRRLTKI